MSRNPFRVLGISSFSTEADVKSRYRELCRTYHPDNPTGDKAKFEEVQKAYKEIKDNKLFSTILREKSVYRYHKSLFNIVTEGGF